MSEPEFVVRSVGEDAVFSASGDRVERDAGRGRSRRSERPSRSESPEGPVVVAQSSPESVQRPFLLGLVDRFVELLSALWERLRSL